MRRIVIIGAGFAGFEAARRLQSRLDRRRHLEIALVSDTSHFVYVPFLPHVAAGRLDPTAIAVPLRETFSEAIRVRRQRVHELDLERGRIATDREEIAFDYLLLAPGMSADWGDHPEWARHAFPFETPSDAVRIRDAAAASLSRAREIRDPDRLDALLTFAVVGGGPAGVEVMAELATALRKADESQVPARLKRHLRFVLFERTSSLLPELPTDLARAARERLEELGVEIRTGVEVEGCSAEGVELADADRLRAEHVVWCAGKRTRPCLANSDLPRDRGGRIAVDETLQVADHSGIYAAGDAASVQVGLPRTARIAGEQGRVAADNLAAMLDGRAPVHWEYEEPNWLLSLGGGRAATRVGRETVTGPAARALYRVRHASLKPDALAGTQLGEPSFPGS